jgi:hypothetical protein
MKEALSSSQTSVLATAKRPNFPEGTIFHSHRRENLKSYKFPLVPIPSHANPIHTSPIYMCKTRLIVIHQNMSWSSK